jgi:hypothetical protein
MRLFTCSSCRQLLFFENTRCQCCGHRLAYLPGLQVLSALDVAGPESGETGAGCEFIALAPEANRQRFRLCQNYEKHHVCNWAVPADTEEPFCQSCALNDTIPNLDAPDAKQAWVRLETAKRRLMYSLIELGLPIDRRSEKGACGLAFSFKASTADEKVFTGHSDGLITINIAEASDPFREKTREEMGETYRTLLGHFRHEIGHYYWDRLIKSGRWLDPFRALFGDDTNDYADAQKRHYDDGPHADWAERFVSAYASMHPWEDWAETFAHYLHMVDTLETAGAYGLALKPNAASGVPIANVATRRLHFDDFAALIAAWFPLTNALNSLNRSMGLADLYPFVLSESAIGKLRFVHDVIAQNAVPQDPRDKPKDDNRDRDDKTPEVPPTEPPPVPVKDPPPAGKPPYVVT